MDKVDARTLARRVRLDPALLSPVQLGISKPGDSPLGPKPSSGAGAANIPDEEVQTRRARGSIPVDSNNPSHGSVFEA